MKRISIALFVIFLTASSIYAQDITRTLINDSLDELFINKNNPFGEIPIETVDKYFSESSTIYYFEFEYNGNVIYREGIKKSIPQKRDSDIVTNIFRFKNSTIYLDASLISDSDKIQLLESYNNKIIEISNKKIIELRDFEVVKMDYSKDKYVILNPLENIKTNIYKIEFLK